MQQLRLAQLAAARRVVPAARLSGGPHSEALSVRRDAAVAPSSCFRQVEGQPSAVLSEPAWWRVAVAARVMASTSELKAAAVAAEVV